MKKYATYSCLVVVEGEDSKIPEELVLNPIRLYGSPAEIAMKAALNAIAAIAIAENTKINPSQRMIEILNEFKVLAAKQPEILD